MDLLWRGDVPVALLRTGHVSWPPSNKPDPGIARRILADETSALPGLVALPMDGLAP